MWVTAAVTAKTLTKSGYLFAVTFFTDDKSPRTSNQSILIGPGQDVNIFNAAVVQQLADLNSDDAKLVAADVATDPTVKSIPVGDINGLPASPAVSAEISPLSGGPV